MYGSLHTMLDDQHTTYATVMAYHPEEHESSDLCIQAHMGNDRVKYCLSPGSNL